MTDWIAHFREAIQGLRISHVWRGYGSALFFELGKLAPPARTRRDGRPGAPSGEIGIMIESDWRIESEQTIVCGSGDEEELWQPTFDSLVGQDVIGLNTFGRLPEIQLALSGGLYVASFTTFQGDPGWTLFDRREPSNISISCRSGAIRLGK